MIHIHHIAGDTEGFGSSSSSSSNNGTVSLRCLHGARGSGIVRVACLQETPLAFAQVTIHKYGTTCIYITLFLLQNIA